MVTVADIKNGKLKQFIKCVKEVSKKRKGGYELFTKFLDT